MNLDFTYKHNSISILKYLYKQGTYLTLIQLIYKIVININIIYKTWKEYKHINIHPKLFGRSPSSGVLLTVKYSKIKWKIQETNFQDILNNFKQNKYNINKLQSQNCFVFRLLSFFCWLFPHSCIITACLLFSLTSVQFILYCL